MPMTQRLLAWLAGLALAIALLVAQLAAWRLIGWGFS